MNVRMTTIAIVTATVLVSAVSCDRANRPDSTTSESAKATATVSNDGADEGQVMAATGAIAVAGAKDVEGDPTSRPVPPADVTVDLPPERWKELLNDEQFEVLRQEGTERAFTGTLLDVKTPGTFHCAGCNAPLFKTETKFESGTGWPSFYAPIEGRVDTKPDNKFGMTRTEVHCDTCGGHLGHVFEDGPEPTGLRYCLNSVSLNFRPDSLPEPPEGLAPELKSTE